ncbi:probable inactive ATP-dependent zinc metalloprotease FTSHI 1, chloroplastic [Olea europaea subsp. europaea]|uniref:Probable inactive ATP-dependent zinc metalloprotease FTSHI 1, chloroplastic n=1 Tax=Olea europaea subsp. europaea TaxID=158383 RepID=A0A8S0TS44_OLEEU|nr:probable inactive ATP-dependent zinc metalloprotease FTSHI 1, chloroplastic [Olea europaea subsp. europaea]
MYSSPVGTVNNPISPMFFYPKPLIRLPTKFPLQECRRNLQISLRNPKRLHLFHCPRAILRNPNTNSVPSFVESDDFVNRVLRTNPSRVEPKYLTGNRLYTQKEKDDLRKNGFGNRFFNTLRWLNSKVLMSENDKESDQGNLMKSEEEVYLPDILREYKGKLYVPKQVFGASLSEEKEFDKNMEELPKLRYNDFRKYLKSDQVKLLSFKEDSGISYGYRDFVVDLKETPGGKSFRNAKWVMKLDQNQTQALLKEYKGPRYKIEKHVMASVGKLTEYPHPVASKISSRIMVELGVLTAVMAAAATVVGGFLTSALFAVTGTVFAVAIYVIWPITKPIFMKLFGVLEKIYNNLDVLHEEILSKFYELYISGGASANIEMLKPIMLVLMIMVFLTRFTLSRRPKNFRKWDMWQVSEFCQSKSEARVDGSTGVTFNDVAGIEVAVEELQELVRYLKDPELFDKMGIKPPHGVLLDGPPGCGKTLVAKAIAGEAGVPFYQMAGPEFVEILVGAGAARIRDLFMRAKVNKPSVIFIDEIDALGARRQGISRESKDHINNAQTQERETTLNQLLVELDGFDTSKGVIFLGATNRMDLLDPALLRPGRFDRKIKVKPPNAKGRLEILKVHARKVKLSDTVDLSSYANNLQGWSGAKLAQLLKEAALIAGRKRYFEEEEKHNTILTEDMDEAVDRLRIGPKRVGMILSEQGQTRRAAVEVGVALTAHLLRRLENAKVECCDRASIIPRGKTKSRVLFHSLDEDLYIFESRPQMLHRLQIKLGGRAAEEVIFGRNISNASVEYHADASRLAHEIVTLYDFERSLYDYSNLSAPPLNFNLDNETHRKTEKLTLDKYGKTVAMLRMHSAALCKTIQVLLNREEITGDDIEFILDNYPPQTPTNLVLDEKDPGSLPYMKQMQAQSKELDYFIDLMKKNEAFR